MTAILPSTPGRGVGVRAWDEVPRRFASMQAFRGIVPRPGAHCRPRDPR